MLDLSYVVNRKITIFMYMVIQQFSVALDTNNTNSLQLDVETRYSVFEKLHIPLVRSVKDTVVNNWL